MSKDELNTDGAKVSKFRRIAAVIGIVLLAGMYVVSLIAALGNWKYSHEIFMTALYMSIAVPVIIYIIQAFYKLGKRKNNEADKQ